MHVGREHGGQHVLDVEDGLATVGDGHVHGLLDAQLPLALADGDEAVLVDGGQATELAVLADQAVVLVQAEERDLAVALLAHGHHELIIGVEDGVAVAAHAARHGALHVGQVLQGVDVLQAQVIGGHVGDDGHVAMLEAETAAHQAAARRFQHGHVHHGLLQHELRAGRTGAIALHQQAVLDVHAVAAGHAHLVAHAAHQVRGEARGGGLAVGAGDGDDGDAARRARREEHVHHRFRHVAAEATRGVQVHAEARRGVHLQHRATALVQRHADVIGHDVDAADVQVDDAADTLGEEDVEGVHHFGDVIGGAAGAEVGRGLQVDHLVLRRARSRASGPSAPSSFKVWSSMSMRVSTFSCP